MNQSYGIKKFSKGSEVEAAREAMAQAGTLPKGLQAPQSQVQDTNTEIVATLKYGAGKTEEIIGANAHDLKNKLNARSIELKRAGENGKVYVSYVTRPIGSVTPTPIAVAAVTPVSKVTEKIEKFETKDFIATIKQENGQWVGELVYKVGGGTEKFVAPSKSGLTQQILIGKGHASVQVRRMAREQKFGVETEKSYLFEGFTQEEYDALPEKAKQKLVDAAALTAAVAFKNAHPSYYNSAKNWETIKRFLDMKQLPYTFVNLNYAYDMLVDELEVDVKEPTVVSEAPLTEDSEEVVVPAQETVAEPTTQPQLRKRGTTGLLPSFSGGGNVELDKLEESNGSRELSEAELKKLSPSEHRKLYQASLKRELNNGITYATPVNRKF